MTADRAGSPPDNPPRGAVTSKLAPLEWIALGLGLAALGPYLLVPYLPSSDLPNHAARLFLECRRHDPQLQALYLVRPALIPNLSLDLANLPLCGLVPPVTVVKAVLIASLALMTLAGWALQRKVYGKASVGLLALPATAASLVTLMGYVNYLSGVAVLLAMVAILIDRLDDDRWAMGVGAVGGALLFLCHIFALGLALVVFFGLNLKGSLSPRRWIPAGLRTLAMFALPLLLVAASERDGLPFSVHLGDKLFTLIIPLLSGLPSLGEIALIAAFVVSLAVLLVLRRRAADPRLLLAFVLAVVYAYALPFQINDAIDISSRTMAAALPLLALSIPPSAGRRAEGVFAAACVALLAFHLSTAALVWPRFSRQTEELRAALPAIPSGARVLSVWQGSGPAPAQVAAPAAYAHLAAYAVIDRKAFNPIEFMGRGMQPLSPAPALAPLTPRPSRPLEAQDARQLAEWSGPPTPAMVEAKQAYAIGWPRTFDRVLYLHFGSAPNFDPERLQTLVAGSFFSILQPRPACATTAVPKP